MEGRLGRPAEISTGPCVTGQREDSAERQGAHNAGDGADEDMAGPVRPNALQYTPSIATIGVLAEVNFWVTGR